MVGGKLTETRQIFAIPTDIRFEKDMRPNFVKADQMREI